MVSLVDIVPQTRKVQLAAGELELRGLGLRQIADLFKACPAVRNMFVDSAPVVTLADLIVQAPDGVGLVMEYGTGQPGAAEAVANGALSPDELLDCLVVIGELTFPNGAGPLWERLMVMLGGLAIGQYGRGPDTSSLPPPNGLLPADTVTPT